MRGGGGAGRGWEWRGFCRSLRPESPSSHAQAPHYVSAAGRIRKMRKPPSASPPRSPSSWETKQRLMGNGGQGGKGGGLSGQEDLSSHPDGMLCGFRQVP